MWLNANRPAGSTNGWVSASWRVDSLDGRRRWTRRLVVSVGADARRRRDRRGRPGCHDGRRACRRPASHAAPQPKPAIPNRSSRPANGHSSSIRNGSAARATKCSHIGGDDTRECPTGCPRERFGACRRQVQVEMDGRDGALAIPIGRDRVTDAVDSFAALIDAPARPLLPARDGHPRQRDRGRGRRGRCRARGLAVARPAA